MAALKLRIPDTNRNLAAQVIRLAAAVCSATGPRFASAGRTIVIPILKACSDSKPAVQTAVAQFATDYVTQCGWGLLGEPISEAMEKGTSGGKVVLLECFNTLVSGSHPPRDEQEAIVILCAAAVGLQDKGLEPRRLASDLIGHLQTAGVASIPQGAGSLLSADKLAALSEKMGPAESAASSALHSGRPGRVMATASAQSTARSASANGRPATAGATPGYKTVRGTSADPRPATAGVRSATGGKSALMPQASNVSVSGTDESEAMIHLVDEAEKEDRRVPQRSFKFEQRIGEAKDLHACLSPAISAPLASLMFSADFKKHCLACDKLAVRYPSCQLLQLSVVYHMH
jgi:hypothetical protein